MPVAQGLSLGDGRGRRPVGVQARCQCHVACPRQPIAYSREDGGQPPPGVQDQHPGTGTAFRHGQIRTIPRRAGWQPLAHAYLRPYTERLFGYSVAGAVRFANAESRNATPAYPGNWRGSTNAPVPTLSRRWADLSRVIMRARI